ncbi:MAG TPA: hypothetical protein VNB51_00025 [Candidatus Udaeobacter sp.]|jgi:hypothetical protein|nr:hypothetical protein [Candidatus Udaeobacter sp.]
MIELEDIWVWLPAIDARVTLEVLPDSLSESLCLSNSSDMRRSDLLRAISPVPILRVCALTREADPVARLTKERPEWKFCQGLGLIADPTCTQPEGCVERQLRRPWSGHDILCLDGPAWRKQRCPVLPPVTIGAAHLALVDLLLNASPGPPAAGVIGEVSNLIADMIELEHNDVAFAAVDAWMRLQILDDLLAHLSASLVDLAD